MKDQLSINRERAAKKALITQLAKFEGSRFISELGPGIVQLHRTKGEAYFVTDTDDRYKIDFVISQSNGSFVADVAKQTRRFNLLNQPKIARRRRHKDVIE